MALLNVNFFSDALGMSTSMNVILPEYVPGDESKYPVLYLLHGMSDDQNAWCRFTSIERYARERGIAVVMPTTALGWYTDMYYGYDYFTFISSELPKIVRNFFPRISDKREDTFVAGLSMGGYGALKCALCAPETFAAAGCLSGALDVNSLYKEWSENENMKGYCEDVFGPRRKLKTSGNDLFYEAEKLAASDLPKPKIFTWCGKQDFLYKDNRRAVRKLTSLGYDVTPTWSDGDHQWKYWDEHIQNVLDWMGFERKGAK
ncbi:MAG: esterase family protein [Clostridia bacterium]|nr:esterase family protein [Clostridia bacterium]